MAESRSNRAAVQATNDDASASKLYAYLFLSSLIRALLFFLLLLWIFEPR